MELFGLLFIFNLISFLFWKVYASDLKPSKVSDKLPKAYVVTCSNDKTQPRLIKFGAI